MNMISVKNVVKRFSEGIALNNVSVEFEKGMIHGLIGRNGSGKTVLLKCICGFMYPDEGTISVDGKIIGKDVDMPRNVGVIIEHQGFYQITVVLRIYSSSPKSKIESLRRR